MKPAGAAIVVGLLVWVPATAQSPRSPSGSREEAVVAATKLVDRQGVGKVCDAIRVPAAARKPVLLASVDSSGRGFCNVLQEFSVETGEVVGQLSTWNLRELSSALVDIDGDGQVEYIVPTSVSPYEGADCIAVVPVVYKCIDPSCELREKAASFYRQELDKHAARLRISESGSDPSGTREAGRICRTMERDALLRLSGNDPTAGLALAQQWMKSDDRKLRAKAVAVLSDIDTIPSRVDLQQLARDRDPAIAAAAQGALMRRRR